MPHSDEEFRQAVIRRALLLGFTADQETNGDWTFRIYNERQNKSRTYGGYQRLYNAAFDYLRLMKVPTKVIRDFKW